MVTSEVTRQTECVKAGDLVITILNAVVLITEVSGEYYHGVVLSSGNINQPIGVLCEGWRTSDFTRFHGSVLLTS